MATNFHPSNEQNSATDPAKLGADQGPGASPEADPRDMSSVLADPGNYRDQVALRHPGSTEATPGGTAAPQQGSEFDQQRRQGATGSGDNSGAVGAGEGMGRAGFNNDEDRGYDQSGHRGGLGASGGHEDLSDRALPSDQNAFTGGYGGADYTQPSSSQTKDLGLNSPKPTTGGAAPDTQNAVNESD
ncbi:hypothetical protein HMJ29_16995 [Hymenobacter taeanensis]|uniref:Uncharacterized protein n=1 Tax=Hymenobacter taeanensis TaxID=2735321 RepID=A0A6M6BKG1_9BACT|nr:MULTISPECIES: hypothetical protein [Hymenobacter]QJX48520.1 hypothetical protein HMJ29_16995 [Hymenobacter taeanensis]UOQ81982.1 hypothetical protein MUN83_04115 [Hymenobacter sp. 5414T-23]